MLPLLFYSPNSLCKFEMSSKKRHDLTSGKTPTQIKTSCMHQPAALKANKKKVNK